MKKDLSAKHVKLAQEVAETTVGPPSKNYTQRCTFKEMKPGARFEARVGLFISGASSSGKVSSPTSK